MFRKMKSTRNTGRKPLPADPGESRDEAWAQLDGLLERRPLPAPIPDVRMAVLARIQAEQARAGAWRGWLFRPAFAASAWGLAGMAAGLLFIVLIATPASGPWEAYPESELAAAPLLTDDVVMITQLAEMPEGSRQP